MIIIRSAYPEVDVILDLNRVEVARALTGSLISQEENSLRGVVIHRDQGLPFSKARYLILRFLVLLDGVWVEGDIVKREDLAQWTI